MSFSQLSRAENDGMRLQKTAARLSERQFLGVPASNFEMGGRIQLIGLLRAGLQPDSKVADLGCGCLRGGYWLIHFLEPNCYCGIEPHRGRLELGIREILEPGLLDHKRPRFDTNASFDTAVFEERFDFFVARSIWTHASKRQIETMLNSFVRDGTDSAVFLTSYLRACQEFPDYLGDAWVGTSHESNTPGCIGHCFDWIEAACHQRALTVREWENDVFNGQIWLEIRKA